MIDDDTRHAAGERFAMAAIVGVFVALLVMASHAYNRELADAQAATASASQWSYEAAQRNEDLILVSTQRDEIQAQLDQLSANTPTERIIVQPCVEPDPTPVFSRDSQFYATP